MVSDHSSKQRIKNIFYHSLGLLFNYLALYAFQHIKRIFGGRYIGPHNECGWGGHKSCKGWGHCQLASSNYYLRAPWVSRSCGVLLVLSSGICHHCSPSHQSLKEVCLCLCGPVTIEPHLRPWSDLCSDLASFRLFSTSLRLCTHLWDSSLTSLLGSRYLALLTSPRWHLPPRGGPSTQGAGAHAPLKFWGFKENTPYFV
jgi:hypothetical protein